MHRLKEQRGDKSNLSFSVERTNQYIVLDLDSTLVHTYNEMSQLRNLNAYRAIRSAPLRSRIYTLNLFDVVTPPGTGEHDRMWGVTRPGWEKFREFIKQRFRSVIIWSAGQAKYVDAIVGRLFPDRDFQPLIVYTWDNCVKNKYEIYKPLSELMKNSKLEGLLNLSNTFVLDDRDDTFSKNHRNGIKIPAYEPEPDSASIMKEDKCLEELTLWLSTPQVGMCEDVRKLDKSKIFS